MKEVKALLSPLINVGSRALGHTFHVTQPHHVTWCLNIKSVGVKLLTERTPVPLQVMNGLMQTTGWPAVVACVGNWFGKGK